MTNMYTGWGESVGLNEVKQAVLSLDDVGYPERTGNRVGILKFREKKVRIVRNYCSQSTCEVGPKTVSVKMGYYSGIAVAVGLVLIVGSAEAKQNITSNKCDIPPSAPKRIEEAINSCQDEIKIAILSEALHALNVNDHHPKNRAKRATFSADEKRIAGCLLQCVYRKMKAVDEDGFPTIEGLVKVYTEGISQKEYVLATVQAVDKCLTNAKKAHLDSPESLEDQKKSCDIAYDVFDCISDEIGKYCGHTL